MLVSMRILELSPDSMYLGILVQYALKFYYNVTHWKGRGGWVFRSSRCSSRVVVFGLLSLLLVNFCFQVGFRAVVLFIKVPSMCSYL